eukprot:4569992-Pleurochrysis_carterae.AAC.2
MGGRGEGTLSPLQQHRPLSTCTTWTPHSCVALSKSIYVVFTSVTRSASASSHPTASAAAMTSAPRPRISVPGNKHSRMHVDVACPASRHGGAAMRRAARAS